MIVNSHAGRGGTAGLLELRETLVDAGIGVEWAQPTSAAATRAMAAAPGPAIVVVGGDGTVRQVLHGVMESGRPVVVYPWGTENLAARGLRQPRDAHEVAAALTAGRPRRIDLLGHATGPGLAVAGVGFDAEASVRLSGLRARHAGRAGGRLPYAGPLWQTFRNARLPSLEIVADGRDVFAGKGLAFVANLASYAWGLELVPEARPDDGRLDLRVFPCDNRKELLMWAARTLAGRFDGAVHHRVSHVEVRGAASVPVHVDGEAAGHLPARFEVLPGRLTMLVNPAQPELK